jgi:hypothetical protein
MSADVAETSSNVIGIHLLPGMKIDIAPAPVKRQWMEDSPERFAYRCLPLNIANAHGWQITSPSAFRVKWDGGDQPESLEVDIWGKDTPPAISHFGVGMLTFHINAVITTPPGVAMYATGPANNPKHGISPLSGIIETDWLPFTFTMNWRMTCTDEWVYFEKDEPFCLLFPIRLAEIETYSVEISDIEDNPDLAKSHHAYSADRSGFLKDLKDPQSEAVQRRWQKDYYQGVGKTDDKIEHRTSLKLSRPSRKPT